MITSTDCRYPFTMGTLLFFNSLFVVSPTLRDFGVVVCRVFLVTDAELWAETCVP